MAADFATVMAPSGRFTTPVPAPLPPGRHYAVSRGEGYLAGTFPDGITTVEGAPTSASVSIRLRAPGHPSDGVIIYETVSAASGEWNAPGLSEDFRFDVVGRKAGERDVVASDVTPVI